MCGLAGIHHNDGAPVDSAALLRMREHMHARGPDGAGLWLDPRGGLGLAHRRLAILDLSTAGAQPMATPDGRYRIVFNGEIYNHPELRAWCEARGARYTGHSDTQTLLHLYALQGEAMLPRLRGMFAFALWDVAERTLLLARDPLGIKPLYYSERGGTLAFASQVKALQAGGFGGGIDAAGLVSFLLWGYVLEPHTIDAAIRALPTDADLYAVVIGLRPSRVEPLTKADLRRELGVQGTIAPALLARRKTGFNVLVREWLMDDGQHTGAQHGLHAWARTITASMTGSST